MKRMSIAALWGRVTLALCLGLGGFALAGCSLESRPSEAAGAGVQNSDSDWGDAPSSAEALPPATEEDAVQATVQGEEPRDSSTAPASAAHSTTFFAFDTVITLTVYGEDGSAEALLDTLEDRCRYFEQCFSRTLEGSDIWRINQSQGEPVTVNAETAELIQRGLDYGVASEGLFDITIGSVSSLWDFKEGLRPDDDVLAAALAHVDYRSVKVAGTEITLTDPEAMLDLGGIAKGYIADDLAELVRDSGCPSAILNLGGNVVVVGTKPGGSLWNVGIQDPNGPTNAKVMATVQCRDASVVTSGLYERQFVQDGQAYHHILDPRTGYPVQTDLVSVSLITTSSTEADALATWMFMLGSQQARAYLEQQTGVEGLLCTVDGSIATTTAAPFVVNSEETL